MTKKEFLELCIDKKIEYLNKKLSEGQTVIRMREDLGVGEKLLQKIIKENGYKYNQKEKRYYKDTTNVIEVVASNEIQIKNFNSEAKGTSFRVYGETLTKWKEFCSKHKKYSNQDLVSMALEEYIKKYK